jgi:putative transposase
MGRLARIVIPGLPHHVTQRRNRREPIFFENGDQEICRDLLAEQTRRTGVAVWAYCLMPNHVHLVLTPETAEGDGRSARLIAAHLMAAVSYVSPNPVRARLVGRALDSPWSSVRAHLAGVDDELVDVRPILDPEPRFAATLEEGGDEGFARCGARRDRAGRSGRRSSSPDWSAYSAVRSLGARRGASPATSWRGSWTWGFRHRVDLHAGATLGARLRSSSSEASRLMHDQIASHFAELRALCRQFAVNRLELFGSGARGLDFDPASSDADFLVEFQAEARLPPLQQFFGLNEALEQLLGRRVDLIEAGAVRNPYLLARMNEARELIYAA